MKLIRTRHSTIEPIEIDEGKIRRGEVRYAILSHRWGAHEISYQDAVNSTDRRKEIEGTKGYHKVRQFCEKVKSEYEYAWVDTCCINKESSAELSEAINSMYRWYQMAGVCYAYLNDVNFSTDKSQLHANIERSLWFTRGWTLQELIAPPDVRFLASDWREIGTKSTLSLLISKITLIDERILLRQVPLHDVSIAQRMSWASRRVTSRIEDIAYCLMGIFDVNMPLLYGEGEKAFIRLQEEIMKSSEDQTIFAWERHDVSRSSPSGLLAQSPADYILSTTMIPFQCSAKDLPFEVTNRDIQFSQHFSNQIQATDEHTDITLTLNCLDTSASSLVGLELQKSKDKTSFVRIAPQLHRHIAWSEFHCAEYASISATKRLPPLYRGADMMEALDDKSMKRAEIPESAHKGKNIIVFIDW